MRTSLLIRQHCCAILAFAQRRVGPDAHQEGAAETFLVAWRRFDSVPDSALPWVHKVATFTIANFRWRDAQALARDGRIQFAISNHSAGAEDETINAVTIDWAFASLGPTVQEVLWLAVWDALSSVDGATLLGCSVTAYKAGRLDATLGDPLAKKPMRAPKVLVTSDGGSSWTTQAAPVHVE